MNTSELRTKPETRKPIMETPMDGTRRYAILLSTMRSGSTLLKALIAGAPDIAHLPEVNFQKVLRSESDRKALESRHSERILLLKRPAWFNETKSYPRICEDVEIRRIILLRDAYETVRSVGRMMLGKTFDRFPGLLAQQWIAKRYWVPITRNLLQHQKAFPHSSLLLTYEDILQDPETHTRAVFEFLGSSQQEGVRSYSSPENFRWKWGTDDGSPRIRSREVLPPRAPQPEDRRRKRKISSLPEVTRLRQEIGYSESSAESEEGRVTQAIS